MTLALLVPGAGGQLGSTLLDAVRFERNTFARPLTRAQLDVADPFAVKDMVELWARVVRSDSPDHRLVVVNATGYTAVDDAESDEETAYAVNAVAPALLAQACAAAGARLIHLSTDYVFPGNRVEGPPYEVEDPTGPRTAYGRTKLAGELAVRELHPGGGYVVRTSWLYGGPGSFVSTMARLAADGQAVPVVDDQRGSPTWSRDLAAGVLALARSDAPPGTYHASGGGDTTWHGLARAVFEEVGADPARVLPATTDDVPRPAPRPAYSVLSPASWQAAGLPALPFWREALRTCLRDRPAQPTATPRAAPASTSEG